MNSMIEMKKYIDEEHHIDDIHLKEITGQKIIIFGAAGSIGSGLVLELAGLNPKEILLVDNNESSLFYLLRSELLKNVKFSYRVCDIRNSQKIENIITTFKPSFVFNAAAYKHVSLVQDNLDEGLAVNVLGAHNIIRSCDNNGVKRLVHISTDKAVDVSNYMGMTKRLSELVCQNYPTKNLIISVVRFGNVWGSNGSLIQILKNKINNNEDINITDRNCTRYFMSIQKAARLVIFTGCIPVKKVNIFILDMGDPINIYDLTKKIIAGENSNIKIHLTKLTEGEKIHEELFYNKLATDFDGVFVEENEVKINLESTINKISYIVESFGLKERKSPADLLEELIND